LYFRLPYLPEETCFQQTGSSAGEGTGQAILGSSDQPKVPARVSLKSEKIPALLYLGNGSEYRPFHDFRPVPSAYWPRAHISKALLLYNRSIVPAKFCLGFDLMLCKNINEVQIMILLLCIVGSRH
jgi:hypothetical protein